MPKIKTYVITISEKFPKSHNRAGEDTGFQCKIMHRLKKHTIRSNYPLWKERFDKIEKGEAVLSVRKWSGAPYKSKQVELFRFTKECSIGIDKIVFDSKKGGWLIFDRRASASVLARNDGLYVDDFNNWFGTPEDGSEFAIIYFGEFRYRAN